MFKIWLYDMKIRVPRDEKIPDCYLQEHDNFMEYTLELHADSDPDFYPQEHNYEEYTVEFDDTET